MEDEFNAVVRNQHTSAKETKKKKIQNISNFKTPSIQ
jgi:hypothetical protein